MEKNNETQLSDELKKIIKSITDRDPSIGSICVRYSGEGDEGDFGSLQELRYPAGDDADDLLNFRKVTKDLVDCSADSPDSTYMLQSESVVTLENFFTEFLENYYPGWEINEGSRGLVILNLRGSQVTIEHEEIFTNYNSLTTYVKLV